MALSLDNPDVDDIQEIRRQRLRNYVKREHDGSQTEAAKKLGKTQPEISDMLAGRKSFGEKVATAMESAAGLPSGYFSQNSGDGVREATTVYHGVALTRAGALLAAEWEKLDLDDRIEIEAEVNMRVAKKVRAARRRPEPKSKPNTDA